MTRHVYADGEALTAANLNVSVNPLFALKTATETVNNSTTMQNDDHLFLTTMSINATYLVKLFIIYESTTQTPDLVLGFTVPSGASFQWVPFSLTSNNANSEASVGAGYVRMPSTTTSSTRFIGTMTTEVASLPVGVLTMAGNSGTFRLQWAQGVATAENTQVKANSLLSMWRIA